MTWESWEDPHSRTLQMLLLGEDVQGDSLLIVMQGDQDDTTVRLPRFEDQERGYELLWDSSWERPQEEPGPRVSAGETVSVPATTVQIYLVH